jgi:acyl dehydratase
MTLALGARFTHRYAVSPDVHAAFIALFGDRNPLHVDEGFARAKGFKGRVMHGNILCGFLSHFVGECLPGKDVIIHSQEIQFKRPVYLGDELTLEAGVSGIFESVKTAELKFSFSSVEGIVSKGKIQIGYAI